MRDVSFYGLLHIDTEKLDQFNAGADRSDKFMVYVKNAITSGRSIAYFGHRYRLVTNAPVGVARRLALVGAEDIEVIHHDFVWDVPRDIPFYSAHYKLELAELLGTGAFGDRVGLVDLDAAMIRPLTLDGEGLYVCDHTSFGFTPQMTRDLDLIADEKLDDPSWIGGEFLLGSAADFARVSAIVKRVWARYTTNVHTFQLVGDETSLSAAVALMKADGDRIVQAIVPGGLARYWSVRTEYPMRPLTEALEASVLHMPADKHFLAREADRPFEPESFTERYVRYVRRRKWIAIARWLAAPLFGKPRQYLPR